MLTTVAALIAIPLATLSTFLLASPIVPSPEDLGGFSELLLKAIQDKNWILLVALVLMSIVWGLRKFGGKYIPWLKTDRGGAVLVLVLGFLGVVTTALVSGATLSWTLALTALSTALTAAGGFNIFKKLFFPSDTVETAPPAAVDTLGQLNK